MKDLPTKHYASLYGWEQPRFVQVWWGLLPWMASSAWPPCNHPAPMLVLPAVTASTTLRQPFCSLDLMAEGLQLLVKLGDPRGERLAFLLGVRHAELLHHRYQPFLDEPCLHINMLYQAGISPW